MTDSDTLRGAGRAAFAVVVASVLFGTSGTARSFLPDDASDLSVAGMRLIVGAVPLLLFAVWRHRASYRRPVGTVLLAGVAMAAFQVFFFRSVSDAGVAIGTMVTIGSGPVIAAVIEYIVDRNLPRGVPVGIAMALVGLSMLVLGSPGDDGSSVALSGVAAGVAAGACYAGYTHFSKQLIVGGWNGAWVMAQSFMVSALIGIVLVMMHSTQWMGSVESVVTIGYLGVATIAVPYVFYAAALTHLSSSTVVTLTLVEPVTATVLGAFFLGEHIGTWSWVGAFVVICGLMYTGKNASTG